MSNQSGVQQAIRDSTGITGTWSEDWSALFDADGTAAGTWNERMLAWINATLTASYTNINAAMQAYAVDQGFANWSSMNTITLGGGGDTTPGGATDVILVSGTTDSGILLAGGGSYIKKAG